METRSLLRTYSTRMFALLLALVTSAARAEEGPTTVRLQEYGGGMITHYSVFELTEDGGLEMTRRAPSGVLMQRRRLEPAADDLRHYFEILEEGRYFSGAAADVRSERVEEVMSDFKDAPAIRVEVFRGGVLVTSTVVPPRIAGTLRPELRELPYVRAAWQLFEEFESQWESAEKVAP